MELVVARYRENLDWTSRIDRSVTITIYNKGEDRPTVTDCSDWIDRPNVGREAETYLHHLIERYDSLDERTAFVQGRPCDHCGGFEDRLRQSSLMTGFHWLGHQREVSDRHGWPAHGHLPVGEFYEALYHRPSPQHFVFYAGACFAVHRDWIVNRPVEFYVGLLDLCQTRYEQDYPWIVERLWHTFFTEEI
jgi:hypothetical protein